MLADLVVGGGFMDEMPREYHEEAYGTDALFEFGQGVRTDGIEFGYSQHPGEEQKLVPLPWNKVIATAKPGFKASVKAQFYGFGTISCRIVADGEVLQTQVSTAGPYSVVECSA